MLYLNPKKFQDSVVETSPERRCSSRWQLQHPKSSVSQFLVS